MSLEYSICFFFFELTQTNFDVMHRNKNQLISSLHAVQLSSIFRQGRGIDFKPNNNDNEYNTIEPFYTENEIICNLFI